jgi:energy-coupling factor transporter transmembrane protein EcfT
MSGYQKVAIQGPGLKKEGVVVLQTLFIGFFVLVEMVFRSGVGIITGIAICAAMYGSLRLGRPGTTYVSVVTPPLAFAATALLITIVQVGFRPSRVGIDFVAALASEAPFLIASALYGWFVYFNQKAKKKPYKSERTTA